MVRVVRRLREQSSRSVCFQLCGALPVTEGDGALPCVRAARSRCLR